MSRWTDEELRELAILWPTNSASQIAKRLHRPRSAICNKAKQLHQEGLLPRNLPEHVAKPPPPPQVDDSLVMQPCLILGLDGTRCCWPLGEVHKVATLFCNSAAAPGRRYCPHHLQLARYSFL
jgi:hypothetical protein